MINFFRRIRQNLLSEGKTGKYLKYAIGEIILVVIGILIALSINNWNEERKDIALEKSYLKGVHNEFVFNKIMFEQSLNVYNTQFELADSMAKKVFPISDKNWPQIIKEYGKVFRQQSFDPSDSSIDGLVNSGKIDLVKSDSLKKLLLSWKDKFGDYKEEEDALQAWTCVFDEIYLNEPTFNVVAGKQIRGNLTPLSNDLKLKLEKLMWRRRTHLGLVISKWKRLNRESDELMNSIDSIISLTETYAN